MNPFVFLASEVVPLLLFGLVMLVYKILEKKPE